MNRLAVNKFAAHVALMALVFSWFALSARADEALISAEDLPLGRVAITSPDAPDAARPSSSWLIRTLGALTVVIFLIFGLRLVLQRLSGGAAVASGQLVELVGRSVVAPRTQVLFLRVRDRIIIAAQTPQGMNTLGVLDQPDDVAWVLSHGSSGGFRQVLQKHEERIEPNDKLHKITSRLREISQREGEA